MPQYLDVQLNCTIRTVDNRVNLYLFLDDNKVLQFFDITKEYEEFIETNNNYEIYDNEDDMISALEEGYLYKYLEMQSSDEQLDSLLSLRVEMLHKLKKCGHTCILCNPNLGPDPFPDFALYLDTIDHEGEA